MADLIKARIAKRMTITCEPGSEVVVTSEQYRLIKPYTEGLEDARFTKMSEAKIEKATAPTGTVKKPRKKSR